MKSLWRSFLTGLLVIAPAVLTFTIIHFLFRWFFRLLVAPCARLIAPWVHPGWALRLAQAAILICFVFLVAAIGWAARTLIFKRFFRLGENLVKRVPLIGKIYGAIREIADAFGGGRRGVFTRVVLLEWPRKGLYALGFVTAEPKGQLQEKTPKEVIHVFVPTTPNPTSGYLILADQESLIPLEMSVQEGMKLVISGGVVGPSIKPSENR